MAANAPVPNRDADREFLAALRLNPYEAALWQLRAKNFASVDCRNNAAICQERIQWLTRAVRIRPILAGAWAQLTVAQLENGSVGDARLALQRAQAFAPREYQTGVATLEFGLSQWHTLTQSERELVISVLQELFAHNKMWLVWEAQRFDDQELLETLVQRAGIDEKFYAAQERQRKELEREMNAQRAR